MIFDRVLYRDDLYVRRVYLLEEGVERGRLSGTRGSGRKQHPVRAFYLRFKPRREFWVDAEILERYIHASRIEDAHDERFAVVSRYQGNADLYLVFPKHDTEAPVLRTVFHVQFQAREYFDARGYEMVEFLVKSKDVGQEAVEPEPEPDASFFGL